MPQLSSFGIVTAKLLEDRGLRKADLLKAAKISDKTVLTHSLKAKEERGAYAPRPEWVRAWAQAFGLTEEETNWYVLLGHLARSGSDAETLLQQLTGDRMPPQIRRWLLET